MFQHLVASIRFPMVVAMIILVTTGANAATQGSLGATSTGSANISITKSVQAQISDISDMTLANWSVGDGDVTLYSNVCVYSSTGSYKVTATGSGLVNAFTIASGLNHPNGVAFHDGALYVAEIQRISKYEKIESR